MRNQIIYGETEVGNTRLYLLYNPSTEGEFIVNIRLYDYQGNLEFLTVKDGYGSELDFDIDTNKVSDFIHFYNDLFVRVKMPSVGYKLIVVSDDNKKLLPLKPDGNPRTEYIKDYISKFGEDLRFETAPHPIPALRDKKCDNYEIARVKGK